MRDRLWGDLGGEWGMGMINMHCTHIFNFFNTHIWHFSRINKEILISFLNVVLNHLEGIWDSFVCWLTRHYVLWKMVGDWPFSKSHQVFMHMVLVTGGLVETLGFVSEGKMLESFEIILTLGSRQKSKSFLWCIGHNRKIHPNQVSRKAR